MFDPITYALCSGGDGGSGGGGGFSVVELETEFSHSANITLSEADCEKLKAACTTGMPVVIKLFSTEHGNLALVANYCKMDGQTQGFSATFGGMSYDIMGTGDFWIAILQ
jgi:hypothetical protein